MGIEYARQQSRGRSTQSQVVEIRKDPQVNGFSDSDFSEYFEDTCSEAADQVFVQGGRTRKIQTGQYSMR